jgi:putative LysE/RhtB family amino acid efflux pump
MVHEPTHYPALPLLVNGIVFGLLLAAPVGPVSLLCMRRTLSAGFAAGFAGGVGTALADGLYALAAATGWAAIAGPWTHHPIFALIGAAMLLWLARDAWYARPVDPATSSAHASLLGIAISTFGLTLTNPATILTVAAVLPALGLGGISDPAAVLVLAGGVAAGSLLWWLLLAGGIAIVRHRVSAAWVQRINRIAAIGLGGFAVAVLRRAFG